MGRVSGRPSVHHRYEVLLGLILVLLAFQLAAPDGDGARLVSVILQAATLIAAVVTAKAHRWVVRVTVGACVAAVIGAIVAVLGTNTPGDDSGHVISFLLVAVTPPVIVNGLCKNSRERGGITRETMFGVLCLYLLIGMVFSASFGLIEAISNENFFSEGPGQTADFLYYSFSTLTTTGYGDLVAATRLGRSLAITEALMGQIYLVTVVALIVPANREGSAPIAGHPCFGGGNRPTQTIRRTDEFPTGAIEQDGEALPRARGHRALAAAAPLRRSAPRTISSTNRVSVTALRATSTTDHRHLRRRRRTSTASPTRGDQRERDVHADQRRHGLVPRRRNRRASPQRRGGNDMILLGPGWPTVEGDLDGGSGDDRIAPAPRPTPSTATPANDFLDGGAGADDLQGGRSTDAIDYADRTTRSP